MIHSRNIVGKHLVKSGYPAIFRVQYLNTKDRDVNELSRRLKAFDYTISAKALSDPKQLATLLIKLLSSDNPRLFQAGVNISDYLIGRACYSTDPSRHETLGFQPYAEIKGLRKVVGFVTQHVLDAIDRGDPRAIDSNMLKSLCRSANKLRNNIENLQIFNNHLTKMKSELKARKKMRSIRNRKI